MCAKYFIQSGKLTNASYPSCVESPVQRGCVGPPPPTKPHFSPLLKGDNAGIYLIKASFNRFDDPTQNSSHQAGTGVRTIYRRNSDEQRIKTTSRGHRLREILHWSPSRLTWTHISSKQSPGESLVSTRRRNVKTW